MGHLYAKQWLQLECILVVLVLTGRSAYSAYGSNRASKGGKGSTLTATVCRGVPCNLGQDIMQGNAKVVAYWESSCLSAYLVYVCMEENRARMRM